MERRGERREEREESGEWREERGEEKKKGERARLHESKDMDLSND